MAREFTVEVSVPLHEVKRVAAMLVDMGGAVQTNEPGLSVTPPALVIMGTWLTHSQDERRRLLEEVQRGLVELGVDEARVTATGLAGQDFHPDLQPVQLTDAVTGEPIGLTIHAHDQASAEEKAAEVMRRMGRPPHEVIVRWRPRD